MNRNRIVTIIAVLVTILAMSSCVFSPHPNQKIIVGTWIPLNVEKINDSSAIQAVASQKGSSEPKQSKPGAPAGDGGVGKKEAALDRLVQSQMRSTMEIYANKTAIINFPGKPLHATWKMKAKGSKIIAKGVENNVKFVIELLEVTNDQIVVLEHSPVGDIKITYKRQM